MNRHDAEAGCQGTLFALAPCRPASGFLSTAVGAIGCFASPVSCNRVEAVGHRLVRPVVPPPSIRRLSCSGPIPHARCAQVTSIEQAPSTMVGRLSQPGWETGLFTSHSSCMACLSSCFGRLGHFVSAAHSYTAFVVAPFGITPSFRYRHKAIASLRATATMAIRLPRLLLPLPLVRCANQCAMALSGW